jgi:hypothetical protein
MATSTTSSTTHYQRRRRRRLKPDEATNARRHKVTAGILGVLLVALLASLGVIVANLGS